MFDGATVMIFFMIWQHGEEKLKAFLKILNSCHSTTKFTAEYSLDKLTFWIYMLYAVETNSIKIYISNLRVLTNTYSFHLDTYVILKNLFHVARLSVLIGFFQQINFSITNVIMECWLEDRGYNEKVLRQQI